jgi:hypothetical protein
MTYGAQPFCGLDSGAARQARSKADGRHSTAGKKSRASIAEGMKPSECFRMTAWGQLEQLGQR